jgi:oligoribonuclease (3'-5' exoribonuclease)
MNLDTSKTDLLFYGLDIETTSSKIDGELIQIGLYVDDELYYVSDVGHRGNIYYEAAALQVNQFTWERVFNGVPAFTVDADLERFMFKVMSKYPNVKYNNMIPVGLNIASFDIPFIRKTFPRFSRLLSYRSVDINAVLYSMVDSLEEYMYLKNIVREEARLLTSVEGVEHDALYDSELGLIMLKLLKEKQKSVL